MPRIGLRTRIGKDRPVFIPCNLKQSQECLNPMSDAMGYNGVLRVDTAQR
jgi:hypothetical protein